MPVSWAEVVWVGGVGVAVSTDHTASTVSANVVIVAQSQDLDTSEARDPETRAGLDREGWRVRVRKRYLDAYYL